MSANLIWYVQVAALVLGHVTGLVLGHDKALAVYGGVKRAALSPRWMLLMMVTFTCLGLYRYPEQTVSAGARACVSLTPT